jgi:hypothetical protein
MDGKMIGEYDIGEQRPSPRLLGGEAGESGQIVLSFAYQSREEEKL